MCLRLTIFCISAAEDTCFDCATVFFPLSVFVFVFLFFCISAEDLCFDRATRLFTPQSIRFHGQERTAATDSKATEASFLFGFVHHLVSAFWIFISIAIFV